MDNEILSDNLSLEDSRDEVLIISIDIGDGRKDVIKVHGRDSSDQLALEFCSKHRLGARTKIILAEEIDKNWQLALLKQKTQMISNMPSSQCESSTSPSRPTSAIIETKKPFEKNPSDFFRLSENENFKDLKITTNEKEFKLKQNCAENQSKHKKSMSYAPQMKEKTLKKDVKNDKIVEKQISQKITETSPGLLRKTFMKNKMSSQEKLKVPTKSPSFSNRSLSPCRKDLICNLDVFNKVQQNSEVFHRNVPKTLISTSNKVETSEKYIRKIKEKRYKEIFDLLNPDPPGIINKETVSHSILPQTLKNIISPLLQELIELNESLSFNEFFDSMELLMKTLTPTEKNLILSTSKPKPEIAVKEITRKSNKLIKLNPKIGMYERGIQKKQEILRRISAEREEKEKALMKECVFQPNISIHRKAQSSEIGFKRFLKK